MRQNPAHLVDAQKDGCPERPEQDVGSSGTGSYEPPTMGPRNQTGVTLEEQQWVLSPEPSLQPLYARMYKLLQGLMSLHMESPLFHKLSFKT